MRWEGMAGCLSPSRPSATHVLLGLWSVIVAFPERRRNNPHCALRGLPLLNQRLCRNNQRSPPSSPSPSSCFLKRICHSFPLISSTFWLSLNVFLLLLVIYRGNCFISAIINAPGSNVGLFVMIAQWEGEALAFYIETWLCRHCWESLRGCLCCSLLQTLHNAKSGPDKQWDGAPVFQPEGGWVFCFSFKLACACNGSIWWSRSDEGFALSYQWPSWFWTLFALRFALMTNCVFGIFLTWHFSAEGEHIWRK